MTSRTPEGQEVGGDHVPDGVLRVVDHVSVGLPAEELSVERTIVDEEAVGW